MLQQRWTDTLIAMEQPADRHSNCSVINYIHPVILCNLIVNYECCVPYGALVWTYHGALLSYYYCLLLTTEYWHCVRVWLK